MRNNSTRDLYGISIFLKLLLAFVLKDHDIYLPEHTMAYCHALIVKAWLPLQVLNEDEMPNWEKVHYILYCFLKTHVWHYVAKGNKSSEISLLSKPKENNSKGIQVHVGLEVQFFGEEKDNISDHSDSSSHYSCDSSQE